MADRIASLLETTVVIGTLVAGIIFSCGTIGASYFSVPTERANVIAAAGFSSVRPHADESMLLRVGAAACAKTDCGNSGLVPST